MDNKGPFGSGIAEEFEIGDIVEWSKWDIDLEEWVSSYGILVSMENKVVADRLISISTIKPLNEKDNKLLELFTIYLKRVIT
jgi:hypothetical protein|tara:strand:- start:127 stop:372 length:246 start_codon:yes stop_codon:yes gene_type:complete